MIASPLSPPTPDLDLLRFLAPSLMSALLFTMYLRRLGLVACPQFEPDPFAGMRVQHELIRLL